MTVLGLAAKTLECYKGPLQLSNHLGNRIPLLFHALGEMQMARTAP